MNIAEQETRVAFFCGGGLLVAGTVLFLLFFS